MNEIKIGLIDVDGHNFPNLALMRNTTNNTRQNRLDIYNDGVTTKLSSIHVRNLKITTQRKDDEDYEN